MGKRSVKENKNIFQLGREEAGMTRAEASEALEFISESRIEKIESEKSQPHPDEVLAMEKTYRKAGLCNYYCSQKCPIGQEYVPEIEIHDLSRIILEMLASLNSLNKEKDRLIEITSDGEISDDELMDFALIQNRLEKISLTIDSLRLWVNHTIAVGGIDPNRLKEAQENLSRYSQP